MDINKVSDVLRNLGLMPRMESFGLAFKYETINFILENDPRDEQFFRLLLLCSVEDFNSRDLKALQIMNEINEEKKVVKAFVREDDEVWFTFEILIDSDPKFDEIIPRALNMLVGARRKLIESLNL